MAILTPNEPILRPPLPNFSRQNSICSIWNVIKQKTFVALSIHFIVGWADCAKCDANCEILSWFKGESLTVAQSRRQLRSKRAAIFMRINFERSKFWVFGETQLCWQSSSLGEKFVSFVKILEVFHLNCHNQQLSSRLMIYNIVPEGTESFTRFLEIFTSSSRRGAETIKAVETHPSPFWLIVVSTALLRRV